MRDAGVAHLVNRYLLRCVRYRGPGPDRRQVVFDGRAAEEVVYHSFTPAEIAQIATELGYAAQILPAGAQEDATATVALRKGDRRPGCVRRSRRGLKSICLRLCRFACRPGSGEAWRAKGAAR